MRHSIDRRNGLIRWRDLYRNTRSYLKRYHQRSNSESGFAADRKIRGLNVAQRMGDRIDNALFCTGVWHNIFNMSMS